MIRGVMKMSSSRLSSVCSSRLNSKPRSGTLLSPGVRDCVACMLAGGHALALGHPRELVELMESYRT